MSTYTWGKTATDTDDLDAIAEQYARDLAQRSGSEAARLREQMIRAMLPLAGRLAGRYRRFREPLEDLEQVARLGLVKAVDRYDPALGSFTAYAIATISGDLKRHLRDHTWGVHVPRRLQELAVAVRQADEELTGRLGRAPTDAEVAAHCDCDQRAVTEARRSSAGYRPVPLSLPVGESGGQLGDLIGDVDSDLETVADQVTVRGLVAQLPPREQHILLARFYGGRSQAEIGDELGISQMHVSRLLSRTLTWLRTAMLSDEPPPWRGTDRDVVEVSPVITVRPGGPGVIRVFVSGELDRDNADQLRRGLLRPVGRAAAGSRVEIDLGGVALLDASAVSALLAVHEAARVREVTVTAVSLQPFARKVAMMAGLGFMLRS
jgi:RNA polymerase sigma-B factor